jgi:hypothetical protein
VLISLVVGGCASLDQLSEEGGLIRRIFSREVVADDRAPLRPEAATVPAPAQSAAKSFADHSRDHFFTLYWNIAKRGGGEIEVSGIVENRNGPTFREVRLLISASGAGGETLKTKRLVLWGPFEKKAVEPFAVALPVAREPERVSVTVESYEFFLLPGGVK